MKFPVQDFAPIVKTLEAWQARRDEPIEEADHYYNAPDRDFAKTDEALRLRRVGLSNVLTYKGPRRPGAAKTRTEIEVPLADGTEPADKMLSVLVQLGYRAVAVVRKTRTSYSFDRDDFVINVCLDQVQQVGQFAEVEIVAPEGDRGRAEKVLAQVAGELGLKASEKRSYLEMLLANTQK